MSKRLELEELKRIGEEDRDRAWNLSLVLTPKPTDIEVFLVPWGPETIGFRYFSASIYRKGVWHEVICNCHSGIYASPCVLCERALRSGSQELIPVERYALTVAVPREFHKRRDSSGALRYYPCRGNECNQCQSDEAVHGLRRWVSMNKAQHDALATLAASNSVRCLSCKVGTVYGDGKCLVAKGDEWVAGCDTPEAVGNPWLQQYRLLAEGDVTDSNLVVDMAGDNSAEKRKRLSPWLLEPLPFSEFLVVQNLGSQSRVLGISNPFDASKQRDLDRSYHERLREIYSEYIEEY